MIDFKIRESTLKRYQKVVKNYADYDGMTVVEFQKATKVSSGLFSAMIREGLFVKNENGTWNATNVDRQRALNCNIVDRVIRDCCFRKAAQNEANRLKAIKSDLSDPNIEPGTNTQPTPAVAKTTEPEPLNGTIPFIEDQPTANEERAEILRQSKPPFPGNSEKEIFQRLKEYYQLHPVGMTEEIAIDFLISNSDFEQICLDHLRGVVVGFGNEENLNVLNKYDIYLNEPKFKIEKTKL